jgi:peroxiredoxin Q/BCP
MQINDKAPEFEVLDENNHKVALKDYRGRNVVLFFFPKADTPG